MASPVIPRFPDGISGALNVDVSSLDVTFDPPIHGFIASAAGVVKVDFAPGYRTGYGTAIIPVPSGGRVNAPIVKIYSTGTTGTSANICVLQ